MLRVLIGSVSNEYINNCYVPDFLFVFCKEKFWQCYVMELVSKFNYFICFDPIMSCWVKRIIYTRGFL